MNTSYNASNISWNWSGVPPANSSSIPNGPEPSAVGYHNGYIRGFESGFVDGLAKIKLAVIILFTALMLELILALMERYEYNGSIPSSWIVNAKQICYGLYFTAGSLLFVNVFITPLMVT